MMTPEQVSQYIGLPWAEGAEGPEAYSCWGLLRHLQREYYGKYMPEAPIGDEDGCRAVHQRCLDEGEWEVVEMPRDGDGVLLRGGDRVHVGIYLELDGGGVLHSMERVGVVFTRLIQLRTTGFGRAKYYRIHV